LKIAFKDADEGKPYLKLINRIYSIIKQPVAELACPERSRRVEVRGGRLHSILLLVNQGISQFY
jgi:hypothetical protein